MSRKRIRIVYTGGTFGMQPSARGYVPGRDLERLVRARLPELGAAGLPAYEIDEYDEPLDSANAAPGDWFDLAARIEASDRDADGFVVIHGTDTLAYTASALSFLLAGLGKPVVVTGSQIPLCEPRSDAPNNLLAALEAIDKGGIEEVAVAFGRHLLRGNRTTKVNATELDAFASPNFPPLAEIGTALRFAGLPPPPRHALLAGRRPARPEGRIAVLRLFPGIAGALIDALVDAGTDGLVLRCYGVGTAPSADPAFLRALGRASAAGLVVVAVSQCQEGNVALGHYAAGAALADAGVVSGYDMTTETALAKLHTLFALGLARDEVARYLQESLCGELTPD